MAYTQADLDNIRTAIASGVLQVRYSGPPERFITYRSMRELVEAEDRIVRALQTPHNRQTIVVGRKGF